MVDIVLLDGGMGQELVRRSSARPHPLWSAHVMEIEPHIVRAIHREFLDAGARVLTLNSYSATRPRLAMHGLEEQFSALQKLACRLAQEARDTAGPAGEGARIAGCLPPLVASYHPELVPSEEDCLAQYREMASLQADHVDLFIVETMSLAHEARAAARAALETGRPVWVAWTVADDRSGRLRGGATIAEAGAAIADLGVAARLLNCSRPGSIDAGMDSLRALGGPFGAYANGFESVDALGPTRTVDVLDARDDLGPGAYAARALAWVEAGATIVGGCCKVGPAHISAVRAVLEAAGHRVVASSEVGA